VKQCNANVRKDIQSGDESTREELDGATVSESPKVPKKYSSWKFTIVTLFLE
jgi:hypothetical protein